MSPPIPWRSLAARRGDLRRRRLCLTAVAVALAGCGATPASPTARPASTRAGETRKTDVYGDATLLPDRRSERLREEAALAAELEALCVLLSDVQRVRATVSLTAPPHAVIVVEHRPAPTEPWPTPGPRAGADANEARTSLDRTIRTIAAGVVPGVTTRVVHTSALVDAADVPATSAHADHAPRAAWQVMLWLALGMVLGALLERTRAHLDVLRRAG